MWNHNNRLKMGVDYSMQKWGAESYPVYAEYNGSPKYALSDNYYKDRHKVTLVANIVEMNIRVTS